MVSKKAPPKTADRLLKLCLDEDSYFTAIEDFEQKFHSNIPSKGRLGSALIFWYQVLSLIFPSLILWFTWRFTMFKNFLIVTLRQLKKNKGYSLINIIGLAISMACFIFILLWISNELSYDRFHTNRDRIFRVGNYDVDDNDDIYYAVTAAPLAAVLKNRFPEVEKAVRVTDHQGIMTYKRKTIRENGILCVDPDFLTMFTFPLVKGDPKTVLKDLNAIIFSERMAKKYFGQNAAVGEIIRLDNRHDLKVTGIFEDVPANSNLKFDFLIPFEKIGDLNQRYKKNLDNPGFNNFFTYILLNEKADPAGIGQKISILPKTMDPNSKNRLDLEPISRIHLHSDYTYDRLSVDRGDIKYVYIFSIIAAFIIIIASINNVSLTTARSATRLKEVGLRKLMGANKSSIIGQFYVETIFISLFSLVISLVIVYGFLPFFNQVAGKNISLNLFTDWTILFQILLVVMASGVISGCYPALIMSSFQPINALKQMLIKPSTRSAFRKTLVVFQFSLSIILMISSILIHSQLKFMKNKKFSFQKDQIICLELGDKMVQKVDLIKEDMLKIPGVQSVTATCLHSDRLPQSYLKRWDGKTGEGMVSTFFFYADYQTLETFDLEVVEGRYFSREFPTDAREGILVNQAMVKALGMDSPIGKGVYLRKSRHQIIGVVRDFNYRSFHHNIDPIVIYFSSRPSRYVYVRIDPGNHESLMGNLKGVWETHAAGHPFGYGFIEDRYRHSYDSEEKIGTLFNYFTFLALLISNLGLFGLASYLVQQKTKEIGIRKSLGAAVTKIVTMLSGEFLVLVALSNIIAWPVAFLFISNWFKNFAYRVPIGAATFLISGFLTLAIALLSVSYQSIKAARTNPVKTLKYE